MIPGVSTISVTPHEHLTITSSTADLLAMDVTWTTAGHLPPAHFHPAQDEHFEVLEGALVALVDGVERTIQAGESFDVPRGAVHQMTAAVDGTRAIWEVRPALRTEDFFRGMAAANGNKLKQLGVVAGHPDEFQATGALAAIVRLIRVVRRGR